MPVLCLPRRLPVSFRPYPGEALSSWMARSARVYSLDLAGLLTSYRGFDSATIETLDASPDFQTLQLLSTLTGVDVPEIARCTLAGNHPAWLPRWTTWQHADWEITERRTLLPHRLSVNVCPTCLREDDREGREQYLRLRWFCAAMTLCDRHRVPLVARCSMATCLLSLRSRTSGTAHRLYCANCSTFLDGSGNGLSTPVSEAAARQQLNRFEQRLCAAISVGHLHPAPSDYLHRLRSEYLTIVVEDLIWALTRLTPSGNHRAIHFLETLQYPVPPGFRLPFDTPHWLSRTTVYVRRALLATVAMMLRPDQEAVVLRTDTFCSDAFERLQSLLTPSDHQQLLIRASNWPPHFRFLFRGAKGPQPRILLFRE